MEITQINPNNFPVKMLRLSDGTDLIAMVVHDKVVQILNPIQIIINVAEDITVNYIKWLPLSNQQSVDINPNHIICMADINPEVNNQYLDLLRNIQVQKGPAEVVEPLKTIKNKEWIN